MSTSKNTYKHIDSEKRGIIRDMLYAGHSANKIGEEIGTSKNGQNPYCAIKALENNVDIKERTLYRYVDKGIVDIASIDLPRKVWYKKRKDSKPVFKDKNKLKIKPRIIFSQESKNFVYNNSCT